MRADLSDDKSSQLGETAGDAVARRPRRPRSIILSCATQKKIKKCQQLALTADMVASCVRSRGRTPPPRPPAGRRAVLKVYLRDDGGNQFQSPDTSRKSEFIQKIHIQKNSFKTGPGADLCLTESDYLRRTSRGP